MFERISNLSPPAATDSIVLHQGWAHRVLRDLVPVAKSIAMSAANAKRVIDEAGNGPAVKVSILDHGARLIENPYMTDEHIIVETRKGKIHIIKISDLLAPNFRAARWEW